MRFSRNFGKEAAIFAGLAQARGACCVVLDCDLQHPPEKIVDMYRLWQQGYQVVEGVKVSRGKESPLHTLAVRCFYRAMSGSTGLDMSRASDFKLLDRRAVDVLVAMREKNAFFRALSSWIGFQTAQVEFEVQPRAAGESKWSLRSLFRYALTNLAAFSTAPLQLVTFLGVLVLIASVVLSVHSLWQKFTGQALEGFTTVIILILFIGSILMICLGIIGYYIAKIYEEVKDRPRYILSDTCGEARHAEKDLLPGPAGYGEVHGRQGVSGDLGEGQGELAGQRELRAVFRLPGRIRRKRAVSGIPQAAVRGVRI
mgnify:CR=1 FL=1